MNFNSIDDIKKNKFIGFKKISELFADRSLIPKTKGIYLVLSPDKNLPEFSTIGSGGHFKSKNPNVDIVQLQSSWVNSALVIYIGKAGGQTSKATLHSRLSQYLSFGKGKPVGHWGGRHIWKIKNHSDLIICWKPLTDEDPEQEEKKLIRLFKEKNNGNRPFANLRD